MYGLKIFYGIMDGIPKNYSPYRNDIKIIIQCFLRIRSYAEQIDDVEVYLPSLQHRRTRKTTRFIFC